MWRCWLGVVEAKDGSDAELERVVTSAAAAIVLIAAFVREESSNFGEEFMSGFGCGFFWVW